MRSPRDRPVDQVNPDWLPVCGTFDCSAQIINGVRFQTEFAGINDTALRIRVFNPQRLTSGKPFRRIRSQRTEIQFRVRIGTLKTFQSESAYSQFKISVENQIFRMEQTA